MISDHDEADRYEATPHPRRREALIGFTDIEAGLLAAYRQERLPHAIILGGQQGIGKATLAWRLTRFLCAHPRRDAPAVLAAADLGVDPAGKAAAEVASLSHPDVVLLRREVNERTGRFFSEIRTDDVRRVIGLFQRQAGAGGYRICIVDGAEDLNRSSANALLKLIEEPPPLSLFLIVAHRPGLVLPTIRSRARLVHCPDLSVADVARVIASLEPFVPGLAGVDAARLADAARRSGGSVREALHRLTGTGGERRVAALLAALPVIDWRTLHAIADGVNGRDGEAALASILDAVREWLAGRVRSAAGRDEGSEGQGSEGQGGQEQGGEGQGGEGQGGLGRGGTRHAGPERATSADLAPYAEAWSRVAAAARETDAYNLDRRSLLFAIFADLAETVRLARR